ncbi:Zinc finger protein 500, partial [Stegodyphus mimosarum]
MYMDSVSIPFISSYRFSCELCSYKTNNSGHFAEHGVTHTGARPYVCPICSKGFSTKSNMQR